ncbi:MAG TPA: hypothetical protein VFQ65_09085 [Kofleriaceae bacterium]|nr:hypothetical protein [Kofleriaceae bacterium]
MSWSKIPMALRIAALVMFATAVIIAVAQPFSALAIAPRFWLFRAGLGYVAIGFAIYGALELAGLLRGRAALGAKLAAAGWASSIVINLVGSVLAMTGSWEDQIGRTMQWIWWVAMLAIGCGLALAALRRPFAAIAGALVWLVIERPPVFDAWMWRQLVDHPDARLAIFVAQLVLKGAVVLGLAAVAAGGVPDGFVIRDPQRIRWGHTKIANALWLRVIAISALPLVTLVVMGSHDGKRLEALGYAMIAAGFVNVLSFLGFGLGALDAARANHPDLRRTPFFLGAAGSLWCAGVTLYQLPELYQVMFGDRSGFLAERGQDMVSAFVIVLPLVAAAAIVMWTIGAGGFALHRERLDLSERAQRTALWFVVLTAASVAVSQWLLPEARSDGSSFLLLVLALVCGVVAIVNAASLARDTAELANVEQATIPTATML